MTSVPAHGPIATALAAHAAASARASEERVQTVGASEIGQCAHKIFFLKNEGGEFGSPRDPDFVDSWGASLRGSTFESAIWAPAMKAKFGARVLYAGSEQRTFTLGFLSATPDALIVGLERDALAPLGVADVGGDGSLVVECKTIDPRAKLDGHKPEHAFQAQVQLGLIRALTNYRPEYAVISYTDASFWDLTIEFPVRFDPAVFETAQRRAAKIMTARSADAPEGWIAGGRECGHCPFTRACGIARSAMLTQSVAPAPELVAEVVALAREAKRREGALDAATAALREVQHAIKEKMRAVGVRRVAADGVSVLWSAVKGSPSFNDKAIRAAARNAGVDINAFSTVGEPTDRLTIQCLFPKNEFETTGPSDRSARNQVAGTIPIRDLSEERKTNRDDEERGVGYVEK